MKRTNKIASLTVVIGAIIISLFITVKAYADIGAPYTYHYDVIVTNPEGAIAQECKINDKL